MADDYGYPSYGRGGGGKSYEPFRLINVYKKAKEFSKTTYRKTTYRLREVADKFEAWSRRQK